MKRIINGFEVDWASERVFAEQQTAPKYGYLFEVSADRKRIVRCAHISIGRDSDSPDGNAERLEKTQGKPLRSSYASSARVNRGASRRAVLSSPGLPLHLRIKKISLGLCADLSPADFWAPTPSRAGAAR